VKLRTLQGVVVGGKKKGIVKFFEDLETNSIYNLFQAFTQSLVSHQIVLANRSD
jgi:hypothetical protein